MKDLKIIILCSSRFAIPAIKELAFFRVLAAVAIPRYCDEMIEHTDVVLMGTNIPVLKLEKATFVGQIIEAIDEYKINLGVVMTFPYKIPSRIYNLPSMGFYNIHPGPLPQYRGADPVFQQIKNKEKQAGVSLHKLDKGIDTGPLVMIEKLKLYPSDTYGWLTTKLANLAAKMTTNLIRLLSLELTIALKPQDETKARYFSRQQASDIMINWQIMDADSVIALINACNPWNKGAVVKINNLVIRLLEAVKLDGNPKVVGGPGCILALDENGVIVSTLNSEAIQVRIIYTDEGFLPAYNLHKLGISAGSRFESM